MESEVPDADALEQQQGVVPDPGTTPSAPKDREAPEADVLEQEQAVVEERRRVPPTRDAEAPEADAFEQAEEVIADEDDERL